MAAYLNRDSVIIVLVGFFWWFFSSLPPQNYFILAALFFLIQWIKKKWIAEGLLLVVFGSFLCFSSLTELPAGTTMSIKHPDGVYNQLSMNLKLGRLHLPTLPDPRLYALKNPYSVHERGSIPIAWDQSYFEGKYYIYWGIAPVLTLALPYHLITGEFLLERYQGLWFALLALLFCYLFARQLIIKVRGKDLEWFECFLVASTIAFACDFGDVLRRTAIYEIPIFAATAYLFAGYYFLALDGTRRTRLILAGLCFGLAFASRPTAIFGALMIPFLVRGWREFFITTAAFLPCAGLVALYNYLRFHDPFEFGFRFQMCNLDMMKWGYQKWSEIYAVGAYLLQPIFASPAFPFVSKKFFGEGWLILRHQYMNEYIVGILPLCPFLLFAIPAFNRKLSFRRHYYVLVLIASALLMLFFDGIAGVSQRYTVEFFPFFVIAGLLAIFGSDFQARAWPWKFAVVSILLYSVNQAFFLSIASVPTTFAQTRPGLYRSLADFYSTNESNAMTRSMQSLYNPYVLMIGDRCGVQSRDYGIAPLSTNRVQKNRF